MPFLVDSGILKIFLIELLFDMNCVLGVSMIFYWLLELCNTLLDCLELADYGAMRLIFIEDSRSYELSLPSGECDWESRVRWCFRDIITAWLSVL